MAKRKTTKVRGSKTPKRKQTVDEKAIALKPAKDGNVYKSFYEEVEPSWKRPSGGRVRFMICRNSVENGKYWKGRLCSNRVENVSSEATSVLCSRCSQALVPFEEKFKKKSDKPRGWAFMKVYVHKDGTVYHKGKEQPELKGTLPPTKIEKKEPKKKMSKGQKNARMNELLVEFGKLKKQHQKEKRKTYKAKIKTQMNKVQREMKKVK
jgi:hypothetical protein